MLKLFQVAIAAIFVGVLALPAFADDWVAIKLRGTVMQLVDGDWTKLTRGDVVPDDRVIRTLRSGNVQFRRDGETIDLGPETQVQIIDRSGKRYTTVRQHFGTVTVEANVENVQHFAVQTPHLAAVVKGTKFIVVSGKTDASVTVTRGRVAVEDLESHQKVTIVAGQSASSDGGGLEVAGRGTLPLVHNADGSPVVAVEVAITPETGVAVGVSSDGVSVNANVAGVNVAVTVGGGNSGSGHSGSGNSGSGNSGSGNSGHGSGNSGHGNSGSGGGVVSTVVTKVGGILGGLL